MKHRLLESSVFWLFALGGVLLLFLLLLSPQYGTLRSLSNELGVTRAQTRELARNIRHVRRDTVAVRNSPYFVEMTARCELGLRCSDEKEMILSRRVPAPPFRTDYRCPAGTLETILRPFADDPLFRAAVLLAAVSMVFVALISLPQAVPPALRTAQETFASQRGEPPFSEDRETEEGG